MSDRAPGCICVIDGPYVEGPDESCPVHGRRLWALYGHVLPEEVFLGGCWVSVLVGPFAVGVEPPATMPTDEPGGAAAAPLLGTWDWKPTPAEQRAVLPPEAGDPDDVHPDEGCPDDPDGLHHSGCGCDGVDPINPNG